MKRLIICIAIPLIVGGISGFISGNSMYQFQQLNKPPLWLVFDYIKNLYYNRIFKNKEIVIKESSVVNDTITAA